MKKMKKGFSLLELIFAIVILGIIASFAIPKYLDTKDSALISTLNRDISTTVTSIQSYYLLNQDITKIEDAVTVNPSNWATSADGITITDKSNCITVGILTADDGLKSLNVTVDVDNKTEFCDKVRASSIETNSYELL